jgi:ribosomal-protein-alanine N-acetyltransferase
MLRSAANASSLPLQLSTERLLLRALSMDDLDDFYAYACDPEVARTTSWEPHRSREESRLFIAHTLSLYEGGERTLWAIEEISSGRMIGTVGLHELHSMHARATLAYALARPCWSRGLTTEAARAVLDFGFHALHLNRIEAFSLPLNVASRRVMEKLGMTHEGTLRERMWIKGAFRDLAYYAILKSEWVKH